MKWGHKREHVTVLLDIDILEKEQSGLEKKKQKTMEKKLKIESELRPIKSFIEECGLILKPGTPSQRAAYSASKSKYRELLGRFDKLQVELTGLNTNLKKINVKIFNFHRQKKLYSFKRKQRQKDHF